jgi:excisionase family DNA binding protein
MVTRVSAAARLAVGQWPTPESVSDQLLTALQAASDAATDPEQKFKFVLRQRRSEDLGVVSWLASWLRSLLPPTADDSGGKLKPERRPLAVAAKRLGCSVRHRSRLIAAGEIRVVRLGPRLVRVHPADLEAYVESRRE